MTVDKIKISIAMSCSPKGDCGIGLRSKYAKVQRRNRRHSIINIHVNNKLMTLFIANLLIFLAGEKMDG